MMAEAQEKERDEANERFKMMAEAQEKERAEAEERFKKAQQEANDNFEVFVSLLWFLIRFG